MIDSHIDQNGVPLPGAGWFSNAIGDAFRKDGWELFPIEELDGVSVTAAVAAGKRDGLDMLLIGKVESYVQWLKGAHAHA